MKNPYITPITEGQDYYVPYERPIAEAVDVLMRWQKKMGYPQTVTTEKNWEFMGKLFEMWAALYPQEYKTFRTWQERLKHDKKNTKAINRDKEGAMMQHQVEIPVKFAEMVQAMFPMQKLTDKKFIAKLMVRMPLLAVPD